MCDMRDVHKSSKQLLEILNKIDSEVFSLPYEGTKTGIPLIETSIQQAYWHHFREHPRVHYFQRFESSGSGIFDEISSHSDCQKRRRFGRVRQLLEWKNEVYYAQTSGAQWYELPQGGKIPIAVEHVPLALRWKNAERIAQLKPWNYGNRILRHRCCRRITCPKW